MCLGFSSAAKLPGTHSISQEEALAILDMAEEIGLVHMVSNVAKGVNYVCQCCGLCATGCPNQAARIVRKPENEMVHPPLDFAAWEKERRRSRGIG